MPPIRSTPAPVPVWQRVCDRTATVNAKRGIGDIATITNTQGVLVAKLQLLQNKGGIGDKATITPTHGGGGGVLVT